MHLLTKNSCYDNVTYIYDNESLFVKRFRFSGCLPLITATVRRYGRNRCES